jgi:nucleotide-binding universal stress UspA family protein
MVTTEAGPGTGEARLVGTLYAAEESPAHVEGDGPHYHSVCVPLDGSPGSEHALPVARAVCRRLGGRLSLVHVHKPGSDRAYTGRAEYAWRENEQRCEESRYLWSKVEGSEREPTAASVVLAGRVPDALLRFVREQRVNLLVMTRHGAGGKDHPWLGSVADRVIRSASIPLLLAPEPEPPTEPTRVGAAPEAPRPAGFRRIMVPLDGSGAAEEVLEHAVALGEAFGASYTLVQVEPAPARRHVAAGHEPEEPAKPGQAAQRYLDYVAAKLQDRGLTVATRVIVSSRPAEAILQAAAVGGVDLIGLAVHGEGGKQRRMIGSVADKLIRAAPQALLVFRPRGGRLPPLAA